MSSNIPPEKPPLYFPLGGGEGGTGILSFQFPLQGWILWFSCVSAGLLVGQGSTIGALCNCNFLHPRQLLWQAVWRRNPTREVPPPPLV